MKSAAGLLAGNQSIGIEHRPFQPRAVEPLELGCFEKYLDCGTPPHDNESIRPDAHRISLADCSPRSCRRV